MALSKMMGLASSVAFLASLASAATITGTVKGPGGTPFRAAFVEARNAKTRITVMVLSDNDGRYRVENLPAGDYQVLSRAIGYKSDPRTGITLRADQSASLDWTLQKQTVRWTDIPIYQGFQLMPAGKGKQRFVQSCGASCHGFQKMIEVSRDENGWQDTVKDMRERIGGGVIGQIKDDQDAADLTAYLSKTFGTGPGALPESPADLPGYKDSVQQFSDEALKIVYVTYEMPPGRMTWDANPDKEGNVWLPYFGTVNGVGKLNPNTGEIQEFMLPSQVPRVGTRSASVGPDGTTWVVIEGGTLVKLDSKTGRMKEYKGPEAKGGMNTVRIDPKGIVWVSGNPYSYRFDPKGEKYTELTEIPNTYGSNLDKYGNIWFDEVGGEGRLFKVDYKTERITKWTPPPAPGSRRRFQVASDGSVYLAEYTAGKIVRLDQETGAFKEYQLPGEEPSPYPVGLDKDQNVWYASGVMDTVGRFDPQTGKVTEYPPPAVGNGMRELNNDPKGRMWWASPGNNTVGYLYLAK
jgi:virginiamycin B lyase